MQKYDHGGDVYGAVCPVLDFSISLNPMGPPPEVLEAAGEALFHWNRYPDPRCRALRRAAALREKVPEEFLLFGSGASDLIHRFLRARRPKQAILLAPTFSEYRRGLEEGHCKIQEYFLGKEEGFSVSRGLLDLIRPGVDLVFLCDPNNPTGRSMERTLLVEILRRCRAVGAFLAVDQCFLELTEGDRGTLVPELKGGGLMLFRALTKNYALAGLRLGYCLCGERELLDRMEGLGAPWPVSVPAQAAGEASFQKAPDWPRRALAFLAEERTRVTCALENLGLWVCPSDANFLLVQGPVDLGERLLREARILLRDCANYSGLGPGWYRIGLQGREDNTCLIQAMERILSEGGERVCRPRPL